MRTVWKFPLYPSPPPLSFTGDVVVWMPQGAQVLTVQAQEDVPVLWALVDTEAVSGPRHFLVVGTGHDMGDPAVRYVGTVQLFGGGLVLHVFEAVLP